MNCFLKTDTGENIKRNYSLDSPMVALFKGLGDSRLTEREIYTGPW